MLETTTVPLPTASGAGALLPTKETPPWFDDPESFTLAIDTGEVSISPASLSALLNDYVFNYKGTPLKHLEVTIDRGQLKQSGTLHKVIDLPFDADLQIVDGDPSDPFDFYLAHLNDQLVAGVSRNQADFGLLTVLPDYADLGKRTATRSRLR